MKKEQLMILIFLRINVFNILFYCVAMYNGKYFHIRIDVVMTIQRTVSYTFFFYRNLKLKIVLIEYYSINFIRNLTKGS